MLVEGAIFDVDGTLLDSMPVWHDAGLRYLATLGIEGEPGLGDILFSTTLEEAAEYLKTNYNLSESLDDIADGINHQVDEFYYNEAPLKDGARELLEAFEKAGTRMVIATSTSRHCIEAAFERLGITKYFLKIFTCSEVGASKANPKIFFEALETLGTPVENTWVFEDGLYSIKTAYAEGFRIAGVYDEVSKNDQDDIRRYSDFYAENLRSLEALTNEKIIEF